MGNAVKHNIVQKTKERYLEYEQRHANILNGAIRIFNQLGYKGATTSAIAKEAGISEYTIYAHFKNKKFLFLACFQSVVEHLMMAYREVYKKNIDNEVGYLKGVQQAFLDFMERNPDNSMFFHHLYSYKDDPEIGRAFKDFTDLSIKVIQGALSKGKKKGQIKTEINDRALTILFMGMYYSTPFMTDYLGPGKLADSLSYLSDVLLGLN